MRLALFVSFLVLVGCSSLEKDGIKRDAWVVTSDEVAEQFTKDLSALFPELGSSLGYQEFDRKGVKYSNAIDEQELELFNRWQAEIHRRLEKVSSKDLKVDYLILRDTVEHSMKGILLADELKTVPFFQGSKNVYSYLSILVNPQSPVERKRAAVARFADYVEPENYQPLLHAYESHIKSKISEYGVRAIYPFSGEVEKYLKESVSYKKGVKELLQKSGAEGWETNFKKFVRQVDRYDHFVRKEILPKCRKSPRLPFALYKYTLAGLGVVQDPEKMIVVGRRKYQSLYKEYQKLATQIAKKNGLKDRSPKNVIGFLKREQITNSKDVKELYESADKRLAKIIRENQLVTLPGRPLRIRLAGDVESKAKPVPHLVPPPLVNNNGILPEFVVPTSSTGKVPFDDFSYKNAATVFTAHEGRPGHDLQFSRMLETPISIVRARYAMNSVNVEGWGLYAEDLVYPYLTLEEKFVALQTRLWRVARYYLDPEVQMGKGGKRDVLRVFQDELGVSPVMSGLEYQRYAFRDPGQATSYFHGLLKIRSLKEAISKKYGRIQMKCFNDTLLSFGLMPHEYIEMFSEKFRKCAK